MYETTTLYISTRKRTKMLRWIPETFSCPFLIYLLLIEWTIKNPIVQRRVTNYPFRMLQRIISDEILSKDVTWSTNSLFGFSSTARKGIFILLRSKKYWIFFWSQNIIIFWNDWSIEEVFVSCEKFSFCLFVRY